MQSPIFRSTPIRFADSSGMTGQTTQDVQILKTGTFTHPQYGDLDIKLSDLESMVKNFNDKVRGIDIAIDYAHQSDKSAAGWIEMLFLGGVNSDELWAKVRWTNSGADTIKAKEYRYLSAEFQFNYTNNENKQSYGPTLLGAGLTNRPFVKGMEPIVELSEKSKGNYQMDEQFKQLMALIQALSQKVDALVEAEAKEDAGDDSKDKGNSSGEDDMEEMAEMKKKLADVKAENDQLKAKAKKSEDEKQMSEKKSAFDKLLSEGKACEAQREHYMKGDMVKFSEAFVKPNTSASGHSSDVNAPSNKEDASKRVMQLAEEMVKKGDAKSVGEAQYQVLKKNPELNKAIYG